MAYETIQSALNNKMASATLTGALLLSGAQAIGELIQFESADQSRSSYVSLNPHDVEAVTQGQKVTDLGAELTQSWETTALLVAVGGVMMAFRKQENKTKPTPVSR